MLFIKIREIIKISEVVKMKIRNENNTYRLSPNKSNQSRNNTSVGMYNKIMSTLISNVGSRFVYSVKIYGMSIIHAFTQYVLPKFYKSTNTYGYFKKKCVESEHPYVNEFESLECDIVSNTDKTDKVYPIMYNNTIILIFFKYYSSEISSSEQTILEFKCINTPKAVSNMKDFISKSTKYATECGHYKELNCTNIIRIQDTTNCNSMGRQISSITSQKRNFSNVYIDDDIIQMIDKSIKSFINNKKFYYEHGIPYHFGLLLSGPPATGKSSLINVIASNYCNGMMVSSLHDLVSQSRTITEYIEDQVLPALIVVEDVDCQSLANNRDETKLSKQSPDCKNVTMSDVLNVIDGSQAYTNCIFIFTTNHVENIEPALIRPGRIDLHLEINYQSKQSLNKFFKAYYGKEHNLDDIKPNLSVADLQTKVLVGYTYEQLREYCKK